LLCVAVCIAACSRQPATGQGRSEVRIAAAASLKPVLPGLIAAYSKSHPEVTVLPTFGASGNLYSQLVNAAPFDLFLSADTAYPKKLVDTGLTAGTMREYAAGRLVIWARRDSGLPVNDLKIVADARVKKLAIANPMHAPYGRAAMTALETAGLHATVKDKLVLGESVEQAATFVRTGAAEVALLPKSQAVVPPMSEEGVFVDVPSDLYEPIRHGAVVMKTAGDAAAAEAFLAFVVGPEGQAMLARSGLAAIKD